MIDQSINRSICCRENEQTSTERVRSQSLPTRSCPADHFPFSGPHGLESAGLVCSHRLEQGEVAAALAKPQQLGQDVHGAGSLRACCSRALGHAGPELLRHFRERVQDLNREIGGRGRGLGRDWDCELRAAS